jgi:AraC-like DNA-binding protein
MTRRIERAMALLRRGDLSVTDVCFEVGCSSLGTFSTRFTELVGVSPSVYREQTAGGAAEAPSCITKQVTRPVRARPRPETPAGAQAGQGTSIRNGEAAARTAT